LLTARAGSVSLLLATLDVAGDAAHDSADSSASPSAAPGDGCDARPRCGANGRATQRSLLLRAHARASGHACRGHDGQSMHTTNIAARNCNFIAIVFSTKNPDL
jgi:hypothetical protein